MADRVDDLGSGSDSDDRQALDELFSLTFQELRRLAASVCRGSADLTLNPTALVHEAWLKLQASPPREVASTQHFKRIAARAMRQVLVDIARRRDAAKRGEGTRAITLDEHVLDLDQQADEILRLDQALEALAVFSPRQVALVEYRFFAGLELAEIAQLLEVSEATVSREWRAARAWLKVQIEGQR
jgi:RNA polymerase sigma factor (TIGR02999 family)